MEQRGEAGHVDDGIQPELDGLTQHILCALHIGGQHLGRLAWVGGDQRGTMHDGVAALQRSSHRDAVGDVCDDEVGDIDAQLGDGGVQLVGIARQEPDGVPGIGDGLGGPPADESGTARDQNPHGLILQDRKTYRWLDAKLAA